MRDKRILTSLCALCWACVAQGADLQLARDGKAECEIVQPDEPSDVDEYAVKTLASFLRDKTGGIAFPVTTADKASPKTPHIYVGISPAVLKAIGAAPLDTLQDQEHVVKAIGKDIFLYGKGLHGNYYAVIDFVEKELGVEWYRESEFVTSPNWARRDGQPVFAMERDLTITPTDRKTEFSFQVRGLGGITWPFRYFHCSNSGEHNPRTIPGMKSRYFMPAICHTLFSYIPPDPGKQIWGKAFEWVPKQDYFKSNPEFFTLNAAGKRVPNKQLCFSNPELRKELSKNVHEHIRRLKAQGKESLMLDISATDDVGPFCCCVACKALETKYKSPGGPLYDYLFELCADLKQTESDVRIHTLAYRTAQTQKPPTMPMNMAFPDNLTVIYAPVEADGDKAFDNPVNRPHYDDLLAWRKLTPHMWVWYYVYPPCAPCANIERIVRDLRLLKLADMEGVSYEFPPALGWDFEELQKYLYAKMTKDINADVPALIRHFTDNEYGPAAPMVREYITGLDNEQKIASVDTSVAARKGYSRRLTLPLAALYRWELAFDKMENAAAKDATALKNVRYLRRGLDRASLYRWNELKREWPDYFSDYRTLEKRIGATHHIDTQTLKDLVMTLQFGGQEKALPEQFAGIDKSRISRFIPPRNRGVPARIVDADAAFGYATVINLPDKPFNFGFYQNDTKEHGPRRTLEEYDLSWKGYRVYDLGEITVTPDCIVWFSARSWLTNLQLGTRLYAPPSPDNDNRYDVFVSLRFEKPMPLTQEQITFRDFVGEKSVMWTSSWQENAPYTVLCDQIIFVRKPVNAGKAK